MIAFAHNIDVSSATFVSIDVKVHSSGSDKACYTQNTTFYGRRGEA